MPEFVPNSIRLRSDEPLPEIPITSAKLLHAPDSTHCLGYVLYVNQTQVDVSQASAIEFLRDDAKVNKMRHLTLHLKRGTRFHVYYKHKAAWHGVPMNFQTLAEAMPYLQSGIRVLIEYQFTKQ